MFFLSYVSSAVRPFSSDELLDILAKSRANNERLGITGMLLYKDGNIMQVLEGEESAVRALYAKIARDPRHHNAIALIEGHEDERQFPGWSMGFRELKSEEILAMPGFNDLLNQSAAGGGFSEDPTRCQKLLLTFKRAM